MTGGYDTKLLENVEYHDMLYELGTGYGFRCYSPIRDGGSGWTEVELLRDRAV